MAEFNDIQAALLAPLDGQSFDVAWPNDKADYTDEHVRPYVLPGDTEQATLGTTGKDETNGLLQVDIYTKRGTGRSQIIDTVSDLYSRGTILTQGLATIRSRGPSLGASRYEGDWFITPIRINWQTYTEAR